MSAISILIAGFMSLTAVESQPCRKPCEISDAGYALIRHFEGYSPFIYPDPAGYATIGFGHLVKPGEKFVLPLLPEAADALLRKDARVATRAVNRYARIDLRQHQFDPLGSFTFNLGAGSLAQSTLLKRVNARRHAEVPAEFRRWVKAGGKRLEGLVTRREAEATMYSR